MRVSREQLSSYNLNENLFFSRRYGNVEGSREYYFMRNSAELVRGVYCAVGNDVDGWELEQFNGMNWMIIIPDTSYTLIITNEGLNHLRDAIHGEVSLRISGLKIIDRVITNQDASIINWTDEIFNRFGSLKLSIGTVGSKHIIDPAGNPILKQFLSWKFNNANGGIQYCLSLPASGIGAESDGGETDWDIGTIGLYIKNPEDYSEDILFAVATLPSAVRKYSTTLTRVGNKLKFYFNMVLSNLGVVSNLQIDVKDGEQSLPEVANETLLEYPDDSSKLPYNCYLVDNLYGSEIPALAIPKSISRRDPYSDTNGLSGGDSVDWMFIQASSNVMKLEAKDFDDSVENYMAVYWDDNSKKYKISEGTVQVVNDSSPNAPLTRNEKSPIGIRVNDLIVYGGEITHSDKSKQYNLRVSEPGEGYKEGDQLLVPVVGENDESIIIKIKVEEIDEFGGVKRFYQVGPNFGTVDIGQTPQIFYARYDPRETRVEYGRGCSVRVDQSRNDFSINSTAWNFSSAEIGKPAYVGYGDKKGQPVTEQTDCFLGWIVNKNTIRLHLDLRNEANQTKYGITRYATDNEVKNSTRYVNAAQTTAVRPLELKNNYLQITRDSSLPTQAGNTLDNPIEIDTYTHFNQVIIGRGVSKRSHGDPEYSTKDHITDENISFYGLSYRSYWGDLAEFYEADDIYEPGTLITIGKGIKEISIATTECNGVISTDPGYQLGDRKTKFHLPVALVGRVPVKLDGNCMPKFGDKIYLSKVKPGCASTVENGKCLGKIIEKKPESSAVVECSVRIEF